MSTNEMLLEAFIERFGETLLHDQQLMTLLIDSTGSIESCPVQIAPLGGKNNPNPELLYSMGYDYGYEEKFFTHAIIACPLFDSQRRLIVFMAEIFDHDPSEAVCVDFRGGNDKRPVYPPDLELIGAAEFFRGYLDGKEEKMTEVHNPLDVFNLELRELHLDQTISKMSEVVAGH